MKYKNVRKGAHIIKEVNIMSNLNNVITLGIQEAGQLILDSIKANTKISWLLVGEPGIAKTSITKWVHEQV